MTTIAYRDGVLAADSCETHEDEDAGAYKTTCEKLFRIGQFIVALRGDSSPGMAWLAWFRTARYETPQAVSPELVDRFLANDADFTAVVLAPGNKLYEYDAWGVPIPITAEYYACGSGAKIALAIMDNDCRNGAVEAVLAACKRDPYTSEPVKWMRLDDAS